MGRHGVSSIHAALDDFVTKLKRGQLETNSIALARHATEVLIHAVAAQQAPTTQGIIDGVRAVSKEMVDARPLELVVGNMCRRVLHIIREEADDRADDGEEGHDVMRAFKAEVIEVIGELVDELESAQSHITGHALEHISPQCVVLTSGGSDVVEAFLREANRKRKFQCVVAEGAPTFGGHRLAKRLADAGIECTATSDASVFAVMSRVNVVVLAAHGVFNNGGVFTKGGGLSVALAAKKHSVPVIVLAGLHELSPLGPGDREFEMNDLLSPAEVIDYTALADCLPAAASFSAGGPGGGGGGGGGGEGGIAGGADADANANDGGARERGMEASLDVANPAFDYVPPELVSLFLTDAGGQVPAFVKSLLGEIYSPLDKTF